MKIIEVDEQLYRYIASQTQDIGESASDILRRLLGFEPLNGAAQLSEPRSDKSGSQTELHSQARTEQHPSPSESILSESPENSSQNDAAFTKAEHSAPISPTSVKSSAVKPKAKSRAAKASHSKALKRRKYELSFDPNSVPKAEQFGQEIKSQAGLSITQRYLAVLAYLHALNPSSFAQASQLKGSKRLYFSPSQEALLESGNNSKPQAIEGSQFWAVTNNNSQRKRYLAEQLATSMRLDEASKQHLLAILA